MAFPYTDPTSVQCLLDHPWSLDLQDIVNAPDMAWYFEQLGFGEPVSFWDWQALS
jgi:hypothetical protein